MVSTIVVYFHHIHDISWDMTGMIMISIFWTWGWRWLNHHPFAMELIPSSGHHQFDLMICCDNEKNAWCMINKWSLSQHLTPDVQHITVWCPDVYLGSNYEGIRSNLQTLAEQNGSSQHFFWICCDSQCIQDSRFLDMKDIERHRLDVSRPWHRLHLPSGYD